MSPTAIPATHAALRDNQATPQAGLRAYDVVGRYFNNPPIRGCAFPSGGRLAGRMDSGRMQPFSVDYRCGGSAGLAVLEHEPRTGFPILPRRRQRRRGHLWL